MSLSVELVKALFWQNSLPAHSKIRSFNTFLLSIVFFSVFFMVRVALESRLFSSQSSGVAHAQMSNEYPPRYSGSMTPFYLVEYSAVTRLQL